MAEALKDRFGPDLARRVADDLADAGRRLGHDVDAAALADDALDGFEDLELTDRARNIAAAMRTHLPADPIAALEIIVASLPEPLDPDVEVDGHEPEAAGDDGDQADADEDPMAAFRWLAHVQFVEALAELVEPDGGTVDRPAVDQPVDRQLFDAAMAAQYELTQRFTAEFSIRAYLDRFEQPTLDVLRTWTTDRSAHVRRLVSEGTRPRLPWAPRLRSFMVDPTPVVQLLDLLHDDRSEYVRRSVANNLNDIAKDHPDVVVDVCRRWMAEADPTHGPSVRRKMVRHALRTLVKQGHPGALAVLGFGADSPARLVDLSVSPTEASIGSNVRVQAVVEHPGGAADAGATGALVDVVVHFVKANGSTSPKVFKGAELVLEPGEQATVRKTISLHQQSTRTHHPGVHTAEIQLNGRIVGSP